MDPSPRRSCRALAAVLVSVALAAACSSADETGAREAGAAATSAPAAPDPTPEPTDEPTPAPTATATPLPTPTVTPEPLDQSFGPVAAPPRTPATARPIYFVMPDRFANGDPSNDTGGIDPAAGQLVHGFDPTGRGWHHGGDLVGLREKLPYLADLGIGAIWLTPPFTNRFVQGNGTIEGSSSSYHGYWQIDFTTIDPHLGSDQDMHALIEAAHALDIHVYFDIVVNHTGDVIRYADDSYVYFSTSARPFLDADGNEFDPAEFANSPDFPPLDPAISFAHVPVFGDPADATIKAPDWLNDVTLYHNRGDSTFQGESSYYGDFFGLDDLFTEHPRVVEGMVELYGDMIERWDIDGFRVDTMRHVNIEFWEVFAPAIRARAAELDKPDFYLFGEIFSEDPILQSSHTNVGVGGTLDFIVDAGLERWLTDGAADQLAAAFDDDDWFTDADGNASMQATFFGNHDRGRMGYLLDRGLVAAGDRVLLGKAKLGFDLLYLSRGTPVVYYGDEQGFTGDGGDQFARHDMFPSQTEEYLDDDMIGSARTAADDNFDQLHPLYRHIADLSELRRVHSTLVTGAQIVHEPSGPVFAFSRIDRDERREYVVVSNANASLTVPIRVPVQPTDDSIFHSLDERSMQLGLELVADDDELLVEVPPLTTVVLRARSPIVDRDDAPEIRLLRPAPDLAIPTERYRIEAELGDDRFAEVTFAVRVDGGDPEVIGVDDAAPYRVYWNNAHLDAGTGVEIIVTVDDGSGRLRSDAVAATIGDRP